MDFKDIDLKNSPFLQAYRKKMLDDWHKQQRQHDKDRERPLWIVGIAALVMLISMYLDPLAWRFIFQGY